MRTARTQSEFFILDAKGAIFRKIFFEISKTFFSKPSALVQDHPRPIYESSTNHPRIIYESFTTHIRIISSRPEKSIQRHQPEEGSHRNKPGEPSHRHKPEKGCLRCQLDRPALYRISGKVSGCR